MRLRSLVLCALVLGLVLACKPDKPLKPSKPDFELTDAGLSGSWKVVEAYKDGKLSRLLDNGEFHFTEEGFRTNIMRDATVYPYALSETKISISDPAGTSYVVSHLTSDTLIMSTKLRNFDFKFISAKNPPESE